MPQLWALNKKNSRLQNTDNQGLTNDITEGFNNKVKVLKRISYGIRNFKRFRTRILHSCNEIITDWHEGLFVMPKTGEFSSNIKTALHPVIEHDSKNHTPTLDIEPE